MTNITAQQAGQASEITGAPHFWIGHDATGRRLFDRRPDPADYPGMTIREFVCLEMGAGGVPAGWVPVDAAPTPESQPAALTQAQIDRIADSWDGCMYDAPGEFIDIGASLRRAPADLSNLVPTAQEGNTK